MNSRRMARIAFGLVLTATIPGPVAAQEASAPPVTMLSSPAPIGSPISEATLAALPPVLPDPYVWTWCAFQRFNPASQVPPDVSCEGVKLAIPVPVPVVSPQPSPAPEVTAASPAPASPSPTPSAQPAVPLAARSYPLVSPDLVTWSWCAVQRYSRNYPLPAGLDCLAIPMDLGQAADYYRTVVAFVNAGALKRYCLPDGASWATQRKTYRAMATATRRFAEDLARVTWPASAAPSVTRLQRSATDRYSWLTQIARSSSPYEVYTSGILSNYDRAVDRGSEAAYAVRTALGLRAPRDFRPSDCRGK